LHEKFGLLEKRLLPTMWLVTVNENYQRTIMPQKQIKLFTLFKGDYIHEN